MTEISASVVKKLRDKTGAGMMDCKKALMEAGGDVEKAIENLRKQGTLKAENKSGRAVKQGLVYITIKDNAKNAGITEVLCETDFVARNEKFREYVAKLADDCTKSSTDGDISAKIAETEKGNLSSLIATIGENMQIRRAYKWTSKEGILASYIHLGGKIGVLVEVTGKTDDANALKDICMHIAAFKPKYLCPDCIPASVIEKEKEIAVSQIEGNKPPQVVEKIVSGKINKWFTDVCLVKQPWLRDDKVSLEKANPEIKINRFLRWEVGEEL